MSQEYANKVREVIRSALRKLCDDLGQFEQTTHASMHLGDDDLEQFLIAFDKAYRDPRSYTVSEFSQSIERFLRTDPVPETR